MCEYCKGRHVKRGLLGRFVSHVRLDRIRAEWRAYLDSVIDKVEADTRGHLLTREGWARGASVLRIVAGEAVGHYASPELKDWLKAHPVLSFTEYRRQIAQAA